MARMIEDETFPYGGYARSEARDLIVGDGVRFGKVTPTGTGTPSVSADYEPCWLVVAGDEVDGKVAITLADRTQHVAAVMSDAFHRPIEGASDDSRLHVRVLNADATVWIRL